MSGGAIVLDLLRAVCEAVREAGEIPAGSLYVVLMTQGCTLAQFNGLVDILTGSGLVSKHGDLLRWVGPKFEEASNGR